MNKPIALAAALAMISGSQCLAQTIMATSDTDTDTELSKEIENPVTRRITLPLRYEAEFLDGACKATKDTLEVDQAVLPFRLNGDWALFTRTKLPVEVEPPKKLGNPVGRSIPGIAFYHDFPPGTYAFTVQSYGLTVYYAPQGGQYAVVPPPQGAVVSTPPPSCSRVNLGGGGTGLDCDGAFYASVAGGYQVIPPPIGTTAYTLPNGAVAQTVNGVTYYSFGGAYYRPYYSGSSVFYEVVSNPA